jgi:adenosylcobinamide-GDP ribazoletransferase
MQIRTNQFLLAISFLTRLPIVKRDFTGLKLASSSWAFPLVGAIVGAWAWAVYVCALSIGISPIISAWLAIFFQIILTGGLHEDGLADTADGLASSRSKEQKLAIMRDSRIGSYGVVALLIAISLRANAISVFPAHSLWFFVAAEVTSRALMVLVMRGSASARAEGLSASAGRPTGKQTIFSLFIGVFSLFIATSFLNAIFCIIIIAIIFFVIREISRKNFGGITGDVLGASQQISEATLLILLSR